MMNTSSPGILPRITLTASTSIQSYALLGFTCSAPRVACRSPNFASNEIPCTGSSRVVHPPLSTAASLPIYASTISPEESCHWSACCSYLSPLISTASISLEELCRWSACCTTSTIATWFARHLWRNCALDLYITQNHLFQFSKHWYPSANCPSDLRHVQP